MSLFSNILRVICLLATVSALSCYYVWTSKPHLLKKYHAEIRDEYLNKYQVQYDAAVAAIPDLQVAIPLFEELYNDLANITRADKLHNIKRACQIHLINLYLGSQDLDRAFELSNKWRKEDKRDVSAQFLYVKVLSSIEGKNEEARDAAAKLNQKFYNINFK